MLTPLSVVDRVTVARLLVAYWKERGMDHSEDWAIDFLDEGHGKEIILDQFFTFREDEVKGTVSLITFEGNVAEIRDLVVGPEFRGQGYGKKIIHDLEKFAKEEKVRKLYAYVFPDVEGFYTKLGYEKEGLLKSHFKEGEDLVIVAKFL